MPLGLGNQFGHLGALGTVSRQFGNYISTTNALGIFGTTRLVQGYNGNLFRLVRASDSATLDVAAQTNDDRPDYNAIDAWIGGSTATVDKLYDQSGVGADLTQTSASIRPRFANISQLNKNTVRPIIFGPSAVATSTKVTCTLNIPASLAPDRNSMSFFAAHNPVSSYDKCVLFEFLTAGQSGTNQGVSFWTDSSPLYSFNGNVSDGSTVPPRAQQHFYGVTSAAGVNFYVADASPVSKGALTSQVMSTGGNIGKSYVTANFELRGEIFALAFYSGALASGPVGTIRTAWTSKFALLGSFTNRVVYSGSSLIVGQGSTYNKAPHTYMSSLSAAEVFTCGVAGRSLASEYASRTTSDYLFYSAGKNNVLVIDAPSNDINGATYTSQANAEAAVQDFFGTTNTGLATNTTLPFVTAAKVFGFHSVVVPTIIARGSFTTANFKEYARLKYNQIVADSAAANGYIASDRAAISQLSDPTNLTYFNADQIHPTDAGYALMAAVDEAAINAAFV